MIEIDGISKTFGETRAVDGLSLEAPDGRVTGLLGPNGAGKTTALRILYGLMRPDVGAVRVDGIDNTVDRAAAQARLGVLPDTHGLYPRLTSRENILYFARLQGVGRSDAESRIESFVSVLDMGDFIDRRTEGFSHGERTKTSLARALVHQPQNIVLDEPTNGLDVMSVRALREMIRRLRGEGRCVLFSSHVMQEVSALCDRIVVISHGRAVASGTPDQVREQAGREDLEDAFVELTGEKAEHV